MSDHHITGGPARDAAPGEGEHGSRAVAWDVGSYVVGLVLAALLTVASFWVASGSPLLYGPSILMALAALAVAQMGVHLAFFLHITTGPDNTNNALALAFGALIVGLVIAGTIAIVWNLNGRMMLPGEMLMPMPGPAK